SGWQKQKNAKTIQGILLNITRDIFHNSKIDLQGSGRTDSGVHALCQVAHLDANTMLAPEIIKLKINDMLPSDINILEVEKANKNFHARHNAVSRSYIYQISKRRTAFGKNFVWWIKDELDFNEMKLAAQEFIGMHDFFSFAEKDNEEKSTKVLIDNIQLKNESDLILIRITGSHFLWKMVRRMVGVLVEIGRGKMTTADLKIFLITKTKEAAKYTAPPSGLFLENVYYKGENIKNDFEPPTRFMSVLHRQK
ncbi:MAG: tRNA pseudouridine(38-40) synthase TruA, partial [Ignavibacteriaceae bacterium]